MSDLTTIKAMLTRYNKRQDKRHHGSPIVFEEKFLKVRNETRIDLLSFTEVSLYFSREGQLTQIVNTQQ